MANGAQRSSKLTHLWRGYCFQGFCQKTTPHFAPTMLRGPSMLAACTAQVPHRNVTIGRDGSGRVQGGLQEARTLTVTRCPVLLPTSFGVALVFTGVQEPPGTEVHGPGPAGVLLGEEHHLGRVQPVAGIQLAPLQQDEAAPCRGRERGHVPVYTRVHAHLRVSTHTRP